MSPFELSPEQLASIDTFGYLHLPGLLADRAAEMTKAFHALIDELRPRGRDGTEREGGSSTDGEWRGRGGYAAAACQ